MDDQPRFVISVAAELADMHPQTLRQYDRLGLVAPQRTKGGGRRYSNADIARLREIQKLSQQEGVNLEGIRRIMELSDQVKRLQRQVTQLREAQAAAHAKPRVFTADPDGAVFLPSSRTMVNQSYEWRRLPTSVLRLMASHLTHQKSTPTSFNQGR